MSYTSQEKSSGKHINLGPNEVVIRLTRDDTGGAYSLCEYSTPPGGPSPPPHIHEETDEAFFVIEGTLECTIDDDNARAEAGTTVFVPRGTIHTFAGVGSEPVRFLILYSPAGFEGYFEEMGEFLQTLPPGPPDQEKLQRKAAELGKEYDQTVPSSEWG